MIHSMTGFGRAEHATEEYHAKVEMHSVNRKNGEVVIQLPKSLVELESSLRKVVLKAVQRGRVQVTVSLSSNSPNGGEATVDRVKLLALVKANKEIESILGKPQALDLANIIRIGGIVSLEEQQIDVENAGEAITPAVEAALLELVRMRSIEGEHMHADISQRIDLLELETRQIASLAPKVVEHHKASLHRRLQESGLEIDLNDERLLKEVGLFAERCDISEEIARLDSHIAKFREYLSQSGPVGRSLDFLCQEMNREFNTIGSKANDAQLAQHVVVSKTELEKAREQVQNIE